MSIYQRIIKSNRLGLNAMTMKAITFVLLALCLSQVQAVEKVTVLHKDALGSPVLATDLQGVEVWHESYAPYGKRRGVTNPDSTEDGHRQNDIAYTGHRQEPRSGLVYAGARWYNPRVGRFYSVDPVDYVEGNPHSFNRYAYGNNNPYKFVDPDGRYAWGLLGASGGSFFQNYAIGAIEPVLEAYHYGELMPGGFSTRGIRDPFISPFDRPETARDELARDLGPTAMVLLGGGRVGPRNMAGSIRRANPTGGTNNCVNCSIATDAILAGRPASAVAGEVTSISVLEKLFGGAFKTVSGRERIEQIFSEAGPGARGIIYGGRMGKTGHVFNVVNQDGTVRFLDGQRGTVASFEGYSSFRYLRTN